MTYLSASERLGCTGIGKENKMTVSRVKAYPNHLMGIGSPHVIIVVLPAQRNLTRGGDFALPGKLCQKVIDPLEIKQGQFLVWLIGARRLQEVWMGNDRWFPRTTSGVGRQVKGQIMSGLC